MTLCDECGKHTSCPRAFPKYPINKCSDFEVPISETEVDYMIRRLFKYFHIPETDEQVKIVIKTLKQQAEYVKARDKILSFLDRFKVKLP